jgi:hypothetical protein
MTASMCQPANIMNARTLALAASALALAPAASHAAVYSHQWNSGFASTLIPDGNPTGWSDTRGASIPADEIITDVNVSLQLRGGWNGDLYVILTHTGSPNAAVLLNRPGRTASAPFGYDDSVLTITMDDAAFRGDIHFMAAGRPRRFPSPRRWHGSPHRSALPLQWNATLGRPMDPLRR